MRTLVVDRSTAATSAVFVADDGTMEEADLGVWGGDPGADFGAAGEELGRLDRIVVGTGPGSFAGIRAALAFAQGVAIGSGGRVGVCGLTSAAAFARPEGPVAVVGDARRGLFWVALFDGFRLVSGVSLATREELGARVPRSAAVCSPDDARIGGTLRETFGEAYSPAPPVSAAALARAFAANPGLLAPEPLPIYLNPAVRP